MARARAILQAWEARQGATGALTFGGQFIDEPVLKHARAVLEWADAIAAAETKCPITRIKNFFKRKPKPQPLIAEVSA